MYLFGGRNGYRETLKALAFGETPALGWGESPWSGCLEGSGLWSFSSLGFVNSTGSRPTGLGAVIFAVMIPLLIAVVLAAFLFIAYTKSSPVPVAGF